MRFLRCWKRTRMARRPRVRADRPALTSRVRVIRLTVGALSRLDSEQKLESYLNLRVLEEGEVYVIVRLHSQEREPQRERADVVGKLERAVSIETDRISQRCPRTGRRVVRVLARVVEINPHRLSVGVHNHCR